jgi:dTDP-4-amino-4,6-dideoxygalactose transaminase
MTRPARVPFADLTRIHGPIKQEILARIGSIIDRSAFVLGSEVEMFEKHFASFVGAQHVVGVASGLDALKLAVQAMGIGPGDEVITAANTFIATAFAITSTGAQVVLVDCEDETFTLDVSRIERAINSRTRAIIPVHLYGQPCSMDPILSLARARNLKVIEDCAQSHGATYKGVSTGRLGDAGCFSFYPGKNLGAMGEGGAVSCDPPDLAGKVRVLRDVGQRKKYDHVEVGHNSRLHSIQAAILDLKLPGLAEQNAQRVHLAGRYGKALSEIRQIKTPAVALDRTHVYHLYVIQAEDRDGLQRHLADSGVQTLVHYPVPIHLQPCYRSLDKGPGSFPVTEKLAKSILSLPVFPGMTDEELDLVVSEIRRFYKC